MYLYITSGKLRFTSIGNDEEFWKTFTHNTCDMKRYNFPSVTNSYTFTGVFVLISQIFLWTSSSKTYLYNKCRTLGQVTKFNTYVKLFVCFGINQICAMMYIGRNPVYINNKIKPPRTR